MNSNSGAAASRNRKWKSAEQAIDNVYFSFWYAKATAPPPTPEDRLFSLYEAGAKIRDARFERRYKLAEAQAAETREYGERVKESGKRADALLAEDIKDGEQEDKEQSALLEILTPRAARRNSDGPIGTPGQRILQDQESPMRIDDVEEDIRILEQ